MKVIVAGSRNITDPIHIADAMNAAMASSSGIWIVELVCGEARGVDSIARHLIHSVNESIPPDDRIVISSFPAYWDKYGKSAGYRRNLEMAEYADALIAVWDGKSKGTEHMINIMKKKGKPVYVHQVNP